MNNDDVPPPAMGEVKKAINQFKNHKAAVFQYFSQSYCTCIVGYGTESVFYPKHQHPTIWISIAEANEDVLLTSIENGCQSFVLTNDAASQFLDRFQYIHDRTMQHFPNKKVIILISSESNHSAMEHLIKHKVIHDVPSLLFLFPASTDRIDLFTNRFTSRENFHDLILLDSYIPSQDVFLIGNNLFQDKLNDLEGKFVRLAIFNYSPYTLWNEVYPTDNFNAYYNQKPVLHTDGTESKVFLEFCAKFNCSLDISLDETGEWGEIFDNRTGNGIIGAVVERRADVGVGALYSWFHESMFLALSKPISRTGVTCITPKPSLLSGWMTPILPFSKYLWIAVLATFVISTIILLFMNYVVYNVMLKTNHRLDVSESFMVVGSIFILQTVLLRINRNKFVSQMVLFASVLFVGLMVGNAYSGGLSSVMTIPRYEPPIDTIQELADSDMIWASTHDAWIFSILMATQPTIIKLLQNFQTHTKEVLHGHTKRRDISYSIERLPYGHFAIGEYIDEEASHDYHLMVEDIYWENCVAMSTKTWPMIERLDELILAIFQSGIQRYWEQQVVSEYANGRVQLAIATSRHRDSSGPIKLQPSHLLGAFLLLAIGLVSGFFVFLLEVIYSNLQQRKWKTSKKHVCITQLEY
ncbi:glutamate receptor ionotropic, delta-1-like [Toxorhynchites rutilus septentrionalis]|uniref:glutamate receptor ionotropic, delta-1-like n=1 Tax=Toxorhynchites rutilus septentrionalis TaxID=329112 RepID=UPI0024799F09|nr:glutamate receptor ionotropic, delta-1-like [Toxorhynchites rutilus septentrionalis]